MKDILEDIETRMFALDRALPGNSAARDLLEILHRSQVEIGKLRAALKQAALELYEASNLLHGNGLHGTASLYVIAAETARSAASVREVSDD